VNASSGPLEGVVAVRTPDGVAVRNVPLVVSLIHSKKAGWTYELVRSDITSSLPLRRDTTHT